MNTPVVYLFAKKPVPGSVKTRLLDEFSMQQAADIASGLLHATVARVCAVWPGQVIVCVWPDDNHPEFTQIKQKNSVEFSQQVTGDLGQKMHAALQEGITNHGAAAVLGCDIPHISKETLQSAFQSLCDGRNAIGPTDDGGFYLLGLTQANEKIFDNINWGTGSVLDRTLSGLERCKIAKPELLPSLRDIDTAEDVRWALQTFAWLHDYLPVLE
ncbi:MAG: TIGR04282 family arsenosugar biosynthesis glycosyltransferase [Gammaproteobacteria bacterium]|nr:TIGR04282 family arsenosugar biosynthesis glycosyltransferase [Gammaproteobacteria bacterium]